MLKELYIRNLGIVDELSVSFVPGLNVITGETGAGKSLIAKAISLVLGQRRFPELVRTGADEAEVQALFSLTGKARARLEGMGYSPEDEVLLRRVMPAKGRSRTFLDGRPVTAKLLQDGLRGVIGLFGQHAQRELASPENHREILDGFGGLGPRLEAYRELFEGYKGAAQRLRELQTRAALAEEKRELLSFQAKEIGEAAPAPGEDRALEEERKRLLNVEKLTAGVGECLGLLYESPGASRELVGEAQRRLSGLAELDVSLKDQAVSLGSVGAELEEAYHQLREYASRLEPDPRRLEQVEERLHLLARMKKKYGGSLERVLEFQARALGELDGFESLSEEIATARKEKRALLEKAAAGARDLTKERRAAAKKLLTAAKQGFGPLGLGGARFEVAVEPLEPSGEDALTDTGLDTVEFLFSANPKEELRPLGIVASGGELSRLFLALMSAVAGAASPDSLVFDEVDIGVGGKTAQMVGQKLKHLSKSRQVICITHLPQIACFGESHLLVSKVKRRGRNVVAVESLGPEARVKEVARMLAGKKITDASLMQARALLKGERG